jgi:hypothetical protein
MSAAQVVYQHVPAEVSRVSVYTWRAGSAPTPLPLRVARVDDQIVLALPSPESVIVVMHRQDDGYLVDGPMLVREDDVVERAIDRTWRHTIAGGADLAYGPASPLEWLAEDGSVGAAWPACWWRDARRWECMGVPLESAGVVLGADGAGILAAIVAGASTPVLRASGWGRLVLVADRGAGPPRRVQVTAARAVEPSSRLRAVRLGTAPVPDVRVSGIAPGAYWVAGDSSPPDSWLEIRSSRSGPQYLALADVAHGSPQLPLQVSLDDRRDLAVSVVSDRGDPARGALVTAFRLIDPQVAGGVRDQPPPRRVLAEDATAGGDGVAQLEGLGDAEYEVVAWHPQFGRATARLDAGATQLTIRLQSPGIARGRVLVDGKPAAGVDVISVPDPAAYVRAADPIDVKGGDAQTTRDGRFWVALAPEGGGELRVGGAGYPTIRVPLPRAALSVVELGDIELGRPITIAVALDQDPGCDLRATGPVGRSGLQIVAAARTGPGLFTLTVPEEGSWEFVLFCGRTERVLTPSVVRVSARDGPRDLRLSVR